MSPMFNGTRGIREATLAAINASGLPPIAGEL
jgi:hypothetical protein